MKTAMLIFMTVMLLKCNSNEPNLEIDIKFQQENQINLNIVDSDQKQSLQMHNDNQQLLTELILAQKKIDTLKHDRDRLEHKLQQRKLKAKDKASGGFALGIVLEVVILFYIFR